MQKRKNKYKLILFDIDGTLIHSGKAGTRSLEITFKEIFSLENAFASIEMAGFTDPSIIRRTLIHWGIKPTKSIYEKCESLYLKHLPKEMEKNKEKHLLPGIKELLRKIDLQSSPVLGLLTGNLKAGAKIKLETMGIYKYFKLGAYGSDNDDRNALLEVALTSYRKYFNANIQAKETIVVGDTPRDIACAKPFGAISVAVATGPFSREELKKHQPDYLFQDLSNPDSFLSRLAILN